MKKTVWIPLIFSTFVTMSSSSISTPSYIELQEKEKMCLYEEIQSSIAEAECIKLSSILVKKTKDSRLKKKKIIHTSHNMGKGINNFIPYSRVSMDLKEQLLLALSTCPYSSKVLVTSGFSKAKCHSKKSQHKIGEAVDIDWRKGGEEFLNWLDSDIGKQWLNDNKLDFQLEKIWKLKLHPKFFHNKRATGPHIHLFIKK